MDFIWNLIERIQGSVVFKIIQTLAVIDWIVIFAVLWGMLQGARKGFSEMMGKILEVLLVAVIVLTFSPGLSTTIRSMVPALSLPVARPVSFILLSICLWILVPWCFKILGKFVKIEISGPLKSLGGLLTGGLYFFLLLSFASQFLLLLPVAAIQQPFQRKHSYFGNALAETIPNVQKTVVGLFPKKTQNLAPQAGA